MNKYQIGHTRGQIHHPQTQGKIEKYHRSLKNVILLNQYYLPQELEKAIKDWVDYYNNFRYHNSIDNVTPSGQILWSCRENIEPTDKDKTNDDKQEMEKLYK